MSTPAHSSTLQRLEMLLGIVPALKKVLFVYDVADQYTALELKGYQEAARRLGLVLVERPVRTREEAKAALGALRRGDVHGILGPWAMSLNIPGHVLETAARLGLPSMFSEPFYVEQGALGSYSADLQASGRHGPLGGQDPARDAAGRRPDRGRQSHSLRLEPQDRPCPPARDPAGDDPPC